MKIADAHDQLRAQNYTNLQPEERDVADYYERGASAIVSERPLRVGDQFTYSAVTTEYRGRDWIAFVTGNAGRWATGRSQAEAIGSLFMVWADSFKFERE